MDTKSKKRKIIISFAAFAAGISLLLQCGISLGYRLFFRSGKITDDYQETEEFRGYMENKLETFLSIATGGTLGWYTGYDFSDTQTGEGVYVYGEAIEETVLEPQVEADAADFFPEEEDLSAEERKKRNEQWVQNYMQTIAQDRNLLYRISYDGKELYSNMGDITLQEAGDALPEGYNFLLHFNGGREDGEPAVIVKGHDRLDIYGDGYYRGGTDWYVPGYKNFTVDEKMEKVKVVMLVSKIPVLYNMTVYGESTYLSAGNDLYYMAENTKESYKDFQLEVIGLIFGLICFGIYWINRREKRTADVWIGKITGKIWLEGKLVIAALTVILVSIGMINYYNYYGDAVLTELYYEFTYADNTYVFGYFAKELLRCILGESGRMLSLFWLFYLCINDIRQNRGSFWHGLVSRFMERFEAKSLSLDYSKRMIRRCLLLFCVCAASFVLLGIVLFYIYHFNGFGYTNTAKMSLFLLGLLFAVCGIFLGIFYWYLTKTNRQTRDLELLAKQLSAVHGGDYSREHELPEDSELKEMSTQLSDIRQGMESAMEERMNSERMKVELVANVSHDIKTPLTSIISYIQFLKQEEGLPEHVKDYIRILDEKSERLNHMVQDVFEISKAASGQLPVQMETLDFTKLLRQTLADMEEQIAAAPVRLKAEIPEQEILISADGNRMYRVFLNLIVNAFKYSLEGSRVYLTLREDGIEAAASIKNTSRQELPSGRDFTGRFVRGDESRTDGGSGLGLSIAKSFTEACGGRFSLKTEADLFMVEIIFRKV